MKQNCNSQLNSYRMKDPRNFYKFVFLFFAAGYIAIYYILGENTRITMWDGLDFLNLPTLVASGKLFASNSVRVEQFFNGIPRSCFPSELFIPTLLFEIASPYYAIAINKTIAVSIAFLGMYCLLTRHILDDQDQEWISIGVAASFATLPLFFCDISSSTVPLLIYVILNIRSDEGSYRDWLIVGLTPFLASFVLMGFFFILTMGVLFVLDLIETRRVKWKFLFSIFLYTGISLVCEYRTLLQLFEKHAFISHRTEFVLPTEKSLLRVVYYSARSFIIGNNNLPTLQGTIVVPTIIAAYFLRKRSQKLIAILTKLLGYIAATTLLEGLLTWKPIAHTCIAFFSKFPLQLRFYWLYGAFWFIAFAIALSIISRTNKRTHFLIFIVITAQLLINFRHHEEFRNTSTPTFKEFFAEKQFSKIRSFIALPQSEYRVVSVGIFPSVASYNGFYTLDGYFPNYPLSYKHRFRRIISPELDKSARAAAYFDDWGSRVYIFSSEIYDETITPRYAQEKTIHLDLNYSVLYNMGCRYIISATPIYVAQNKNLVFLHQFNDPDSFWNIFLYKIIPSN